MKTALFSLVIVVGSAITTQAQFVSGYAGYRWYAAYPVYVVPVPVAVPVYPQPHASWYGPTGGFAVAPVFAPSYGQSGGFTTQAPPTQTYPYRAPTTYQPQPVQHHQR